MQLFSNLSSLEDQSLVGVQVFKKTFDWAFKSGTSVFSEHLSLQDDSLVSILVSKITLYRTFKLPRSPVKILFQTHLPSYNRFPSSTDSPTSLPARSHNSPTSRSELGQLASHCEAAREPGSRDRPHWANQGFHKPRQPRTSADPQGFRGNQT